MSSPEEFADSLRAAASLLDAARDRLVAGREPAELAAEQLATVFTGSSSSHAQAAVEHSQNAVGRLDAALDLVSRSNEELSAYMADVLGAGSVTGDPSRQSRGANRDDEAGAKPRTTPQGLTPGQFSWAMATARRGTVHIGGEVVVHGSRAAGTAAPGSHIDFAVRVDEERFDSLIAERFGARPTPAARRKGRCVERSSPARFRRVSWDCDDSAAILRPAWA